jgi:hypothetical protein
MDCIRSRPGRFGGALSVATSMPPRESLQVLAPHLERVCVEVNRACAGADDVRLASIASEAAALADAIDQLRRLVLNVEHQRAA